MKTIVLATNNNHKLAEFRQILHEYNILSLKDIEFYNEIIEDGNSFAENALIKAKTISNYLLEQNCNIVLCSHFGRPKGEFKPEFSLAPVAKELSKQLNMNVVMAKDVIGEDATKKAEKLKNREI